jgi:pimeloyl-ACP methyl ester carboxylesterase
MPHLYRTWAVILSGWMVVLVATPHSAAGQTPSPAPSATRGYLVFFQGQPVGREDVTVTTSASGTTISAEGRLSGGVNVTIKRAEVKYRSDWTPESFQLDADQNGGAITTRTTFTDGKASSEVVQGGKTFTRSDPVTADTIAIIPNAFFGAFEAVTRRLAATGGAAAGTPVEMRAYVVPQAEIGMRVVSSASERMQIGTSFVNVRRHEIALVSAGGEQAVSVTADDTGALLRVFIPSQAFDVVRDDLAGSTSRTQISSNPGDEPVIIPSLGFNLGATITRPQAGATPLPAKLPAAILLGGSGIGDRDGVAFGVPTLANMAGALAKAGIVAVRYDKRGNGQSGGRGESATLSDYAEDARVVFKWLSQRKDIDSKRIVLVGHSEGAWVALLAASREKKFAAVVAIAGPSSTGAELILEQQQAALALSNLQPAEREARVALQRQIHTAAMTGKGWEGVPENLRKQADTPWFQSVLAFDPANTIKNVRQPLLVVHGALDKQVPVAHAERLATLARTVGDSKTVELTLVRGVNHLLVPAVTGEIDEYAGLTDRTVSFEVTNVVNAWLAKTLQAIK